jgi:predicted nucleic acid-binding protein
MGFIIDASVALSWLFADEFTPAAQALLKQAGDNAVFGPSHLWLEISNGALMGERRGRVESSQTILWLGQIAALGISIDRGNPGLGLDGLLPIARLHGLTVYDAAYLELAARLLLPLATFDKRLASAARNVGVEVIGD